MESGVKNMGTKTEAAAQNDSDKNEKKNERPECICDSDSQEEKMQTMVLEPDHPMMERFQAALKTHLLKQIEKISSQVSELNHEIKSKEKEREDTGLELYAVQQEVFRQQKMLEDCEATIGSLIKERQELDESVKDKKMSWKDEVNQLNCVKKKEMDLMLELQKLSTLEKQMKKWEEEMESELTVSQRISEKTLHDKNKLIEEKRKMDMYLLRLMTAVSNYESEIKLLDGEIDIKMEEKETMSQTLADSAADLQALVTEQKRLLAAWNSVVAMINQKNIIYVNESDELTKLQDAFRSLNTEIESYKRSSAEEMKKSEKLAIIIGRTETDFENAENTLKMLTNKRLILQEKISSLTKMIDKTDAEYQYSLLEKEKIENSLNTVRRSYERLCSEHRQLQDDAMSFLQEQIFTDKSTSHLNKLLKEAREKNRKQEFSLLETENKISQKFLEAENLKSNIAQNNEIILEMNEELKTKEDELKKIEDEIEKCQTALIQKQGNYATLMRKIEKHIEKTDFGKSFQSPSQIRIIELEKSNAEFQSKNEKLQSFWLIQQNNSLKLTQQRNAQLRNISLLRKQVALLEQRIMKIEMELSIEKKIESDVNKSILHLQQRLTVLNGELVGKKGYEENLGKENLLVQAQFIQNLKDSELEQIRLKDEIKSLENNLEELAETMLATQREMLAWEKKIQSAIEAKVDMQKQRSKSGDIGQMKAEIHRMEVRYGQLKRVQEKLITDLEQCVYRRDAILDGVDAKEKRQSRGSNTRYMFQKKLEGIRNNIRTVRNERKEIQGVIESTKEGHKQLQKFLIEKDAHLLEMEGTKKKMDDEIEDGRLRKCQNLEQLIRRQKKCKMYETLKSGKHRMLFKSESTLENELVKERTKNRNLVSVMEALIDDFPAYRFYLKKICNTFGAQPS